MDRLKMAKKAQRETSHVVKPIVYVDKKKKADKEACRNWKKN